MSVTRRALQEMPAHAHGCEGSPLPHVARPPHGSSLAVHEPGTLVSDARSACSAATAAGRGGAEVSGLAAAAGWSRRARQSVERHSSQPIRHVLSSTIQPAHRRLGQCPWMGQARGLWMRELGLPTEPPGQAPPPPPPLPPSNRPAPNTLLSSPGRASGHAGLSSRRRGLELGLCVWPVTQRGAVRAGFVSTLTAFGVTGILRRRTRLGRGTRAAWALLSERRPANPGGCLTRARVINHRDSTKRTAGAAVPGDGRPPPGTLPPLARGSSSRPRPATGLAGLHAI